MRQIWHVWVERSTLLKTVRREMWGVRSLEVTETV